MKGRLKKSMAALLTLVFLLALLPAGTMAANVASGSCGKYLTWTLDADGVLTISGTGDMKNYDYESNVPWYNRRGEVRTVIISEGVTGIGRSAFYGCSGLTSLTIPASLTSIDVNAFSGSSLTSFSVASGNPNYISEDGVLFSKDKTKLIKYPTAKQGAYTIPASVTSIGSYAFYDCSGLTSLNIPSGVTILSYFAFAGCSGLTNVTIPEGVILIEDGAFHGCSGLKSLTIPTSVTHIDGGWTFYGCDGLTSVTILSNAKIAGCFRNCRGLTSLSVTFDNPFYSSEDGVLFNKDKTELIMYPGGKQGAYTIPSSVTSIESSAFSGCSGLTSLTIPSNVTNIGDGAFASSTEYVSILTDITVASDNPYYSSEDGVLFNKDKTELIIYPGGKQGAYTIPPSVTSIGDHAFAWCDSLTSVTIPSGVTSIGNDAFYDCSGLTIVTIPLSVTSIGDFAFYGCSGLKVVFYGGSRDEWNALSLDYTNDSLSDALIRYNNIATIRKQPENFTGGIGDAVSFIVEATGDGLSYQWQYSSDGGRTWGNSGLPGNKTATLSTTLTEARLIYRFRCVVIDSSGNSVTSDAVRMIKQTPAAELAITLQPIDYTGRVGDAVSFSISAAGDRLSYQWQYSSDGGKTWGNSGLPGNKTATLSTTLTEARLIYRFRCVITDGGGNMLNSDIVRMIKAAPTLYITEQPTDFTGSIGDAVSFTVTASGSDLTYQWQYSSDGGKTWSSSGLPGNKTATLSTTLTEARLIYRFRCVITDSNGKTVNSNIVRMLKKAAPALAITSQPVNFSGQLGDAVSFTVAASGDGLSYQWQYSSDGGRTWGNSGLPGNKTATLSTTLTEARLIYRFRCVITDGGGNMLNSDIVRMIKAAPALAITAQPVDLSGQLGDTVSFTVGAVGNGLSYQWQYSSDGGKTWGNSGLPGNDTATLSTTLTEVRLVYRFRCVVTDGSGNKLNSDIVRMKKADPALAITSQPADFTGSIGDAVSFTVTASGSDLTYQWQYSSDGGKTWGSSGLPGNKTATLTTTLTEARLIYRFRCVVTDGSGNKLNSDIVRMMKANSDILD